MLPRSVLPNDRPAGGRDPYAAVLERRLLVGRGGLYRRDAARRDSSADARDRSTSRSTRRTSTRTRWRRRVRDLSPRSGERCAAGARRALLLRRWPAFRVRRDIRKWCIFGRHDLDPGPAALPRRSGRLPQRPHLFRERAAEPLAPAFPVRRAERRISLSRPVRGPALALAAFVAGRLQMADLPTRVPSGNHGRIATPLQDEDGRRGFPSRAGDKRAAGSPRSSSSSSTT